MKIVEGRLEAFYETGTEGVIWSVFEEGKKSHDGLNILEYGDYLRIYDSPKKEQLIWEGNIFYDWETNWRPYPLNPRYGQQEVLGYWVHGIQEGVYPETWGRWFFASLPAQLIKSEMGNFFPMRDSKIKASFFSGMPPIFNEGKSGDLVLAFHDKSYIKYKNVDEKTEWEFQKATDKYNFYLKYIKDKYKSEKITPFFPF